MTGVSLLKLRNIAVENNSLSQLRKVLTQKRESSGTSWPSTYADFVRTTFRIALRRGLFEFILYLLENESDHVSISLVHIDYIWPSASIPLLELLVSRGWDINQASSPEGFRLIHSPDVLHDENLVVWMVQHGARVNDEDTWPKPSRSPALLESCARFGTVKTFKFLRENGAQMGRRTLHGAALVAAEYGADPTLTTPRASQKGNEEHRFEEARKYESGEMLRYLVDDVGLDINAAELDFPYDYGTPINYAAAQKQGAGVVKWLLKKGADPTWVSIWMNTRDAESWAQALGNEETARMVKEWKNNESRKKKRRSV